MAGLSLYEIEVIIIVLGRKEEIIMTYDEFMEAVIESEPEDWLYDDEKGKFVFKNDLLISIIGKEVDYDESGRFYEEWATSFPDPVVRKRESC